MAKRGSKVWRNNVKVGIAKRKERTISESQYPFLAYPRTAAGMPINHSTALALTALWNAVQIISQSIAGLECVLYRELKGQRDIANFHPVYDLLLWEPNNRTNPFDFFEQSLVWLLRWGNSYHEIERNGAGEPTALWPIPANICDPYLEGDELVYKVRIPNGEPIILQPEDVLHFRLMGDHLKGWSPIEVHRESLGLSAGLERFSASSVGNSVRPSGIVKSAGRLSDQARGNIRQSLEYQNQGPINAGRMMVLEEGLEFTPFTFNQKEFDLVSQRMFQVSEIARIYNINPILLGEMDRATWGNLETVTQNFYDQTLRPLVIKIEQELERKLLSRRERANYYIEFNFQGILRADVQTRYTIYQTGIAAGVLQPNECREWENLNPLPEQEGTLLVEDSLEGDQEIAPQDGLSLEESEFNREARGGPGSGPQGGRHPHQLLTAKGLIGAIKDKVNAIADKIPGVAQVKAGMGKLMGAIHGKLEARYGSKAASLIMGSGSIGGYGVMALAGKLGLGVGIPVVNDLISIAAHTAVAEGVLQLGRLAKKVGLREAYNVAQVAKQVNQQIAEGLQALAKEHAKDIEKAYAEADQDTKDKIADLVKTYKAGK